MLIEINNVQPTNDLLVYAEGNQISRPPYGMLSHFWDESDIEKVLTESQFKKFETGQYQFEIPAWKVRILQGRHVPKNREQLLFSSSF